MVMDATRCYFRVAHGETPETAVVEQFDDEWDAVARYEILVNSMHLRHDSKDGEKRWEHMAQGMSQSWNARSVVNGHEENVWLWRTLRR